MEKTMDSLTKAAIQIEVEELGAKIAPDGGETVLPLIRVHHNCRRGHEGANELTGRGQPSPSGRGSLDRFIHSFHVRVSQPPPSLKPRAIFG